MDEATRSSPSMHPGLAQAGAAAAADAASLKLALLWRGARETRSSVTAQNSRLHRVFEAISVLGASAEPVIYADDMADEVRERLLTLDGVLVWVDPISQGQDRRELDSLLRDVASRGVWVSAHPDVIQKMGVKEVLCRTKSLGWGTDAHVYYSAEAFRREFPERLGSAGPRVIKRNRGNGGQGVWKVELMHGSASRDGIVSVLHARRGSLPEQVLLHDFMTICNEYFAADGCIIDQPFQARLPEGMIRCYMGADKVVGFGQQLIKALVPPPPEGPDSEAAKPGPRIMHPASAPEFQSLRAKMESEWTPQMLQLLGVDVPSLPIIWDADFLYGPRTDSGEDTYVLCEINVSSVYPFPEHAPAEIARLALDRVFAAKAARRNAGVAGENQSHLI